MRTILEITPEAPGVNEALEVLRSARHPVALTGAGISVESGIPDFRSPGGLWEVFSPEEYATYQVFEAEPAKAWELYRAIEEKVRPARPNPAHIALARLEEMGLLRAIITQNVDGLHQAAGSKRVWEIHGDHQNLHCPVCDTTRPTRPEDFETPVAPVAPVATAAGERRGQPPPKPRPEQQQPSCQPAFPLCEDCGHALKPNVVLFGEAVRDLEAIIGELEPCDLLIVVGTSAQVAPSSNFPHAVKHRGGQIMEFNSEPTLLSGSGEADGGLSCLLMGGLAGMEAAEPVTDFLFLGKAGLTLPGFVEAVE